MTSFVLVRHLKHLEWGTTSTLGCGEAANKQRTSCHLRAKNCNYAKLPYCKHVFRGLQTSLTRSLMVTDAATAAVSCCSKDRVSAQNRLEDQYFILPQDEHLQCLPVHYSCGVLNAQTVS